MVEQNYLHFVLSRCRYDKNFHHMWANNSGIQKTSASWKLQQYLRKSHLEYKSHKYYCQTVAKAMLLINKLITDQAKRPTKIILNIRPKGYMVYQQHRLLNSAKFCYKHKSKRILIKKGHNYHKTTCKQALSRLVNNV